MVTETDFNGAITRYAYDAAGQLAGRVNAAGQKIGCAYDELGRLDRRVADGVITPSATTPADVSCARAAPTSSSGSAVTGLARSPRRPAATVPYCPRTTWPDVAAAASPRRCARRWTYDDAGKPVRLETGGHESGSAMTRPAGRSGATCPAGWP